MHRLARWLLVLALSFSIGLQWALLQSAAWVGMIVSYSRENSVARSVAMTFDGRHPCTVCRAVERGASTQSDSQGMERPVPKLDLAAPEAESWVLASPARAIPAGGGGLKSGVEHAPPTPPPKVA